MLLCTAAEMLTGITVHQLASCEAISMSVNVKPSGHVYLYVRHDVEFSTNLPQFVSWTGQTTPLLTAVCLHWFSVNPKLVEDYMHMLVVSPVVLEMPCKSYYCTLQYCLCQS